MKQTQVNLSEETCYILNIGNTVVNRASYSMESSMIWRVFAMGSLKGLSSVDPAPVKQGGEVMVPLRGRAYRTVVRPLGAEEGFQKQKNSS